MEPITPILVVCVVVALIVVCIVAMRTHASSARSHLDSERDDLERQREDLRRESERLAGRERRIDEREDEVNRREEQVTSTSVVLEERRSQLERSERSQERELERIAGLSLADAKAEVISRAENEARDEAAKRAKDIHNDITQHARERARLVLATAMSRVAAAQTAESVVTTVPIESEDMKGRIIGKEGRNVRTFEQVTGTTLLIDDTPGVVMISCFDPVRREAARRTLESLIADGRIQPSRIESEHEKSVSDVDDDCLSAADSAIEEAGLTGIAPELKPVIGALKYRTSFGQNVLAHSVEAAILAGAIAAELGVNARVARRAAFLHDLGKAVVTSGEGSHAAEGAKLARVHGESDVVVHAIASHHNEIVACSVIDVITQVADSVSSSRPGARREHLADYVARLEELEAMALTMPGVEQAYAMQAGREVRVMVSPDEVSDDQADQLARDLAAQIEESFTYPGRITVTVIRESRATRTAH